MSTGLFQIGDFTLASGQRSSWKIDCDALTSGDWEALAAILAEWLPAFEQVEGVPTGGIELAEALMPYRSTSNQALVVDDVWTTGGSMQRYIDSYRWAIPPLRAVVFARNPVPAGVVAVFQMNGGSEGGTNG